jgi:hypothetical protein
MIVLDGVRRAMTLESPVQDQLAEFCRKNRETEPLVMAQMGAFKGQTLALCGAGPSLAEFTNINSVDQVFACNSALPFMVGRGQHVDAGVGIDQTPGLLDEWADPPDVPYYIASTVDPALTRHLLKHGRELRFFHSTVGFPDEIAAYKKWPTGCLAFCGHNVVGRFLRVVPWLGFERVDIYGADCAFTRDDVTHANGTTADEAYGPTAVAVGEIDGREWRTRTDMLIAAVDLARTARDSNGCIRLMGDTLPNALMGKDDDFLDQVARPMAPGEVIPS